MDKRSFEDELFAWNEEVDEQTEAGERGGRCEGGDTPPPPLLGMTVSNADPLLKTSRPVS